MMNQAKNNKCNLLLEAVSKVSKSEKCHSELVSESTPSAVLWILKQVQNDRNLTFEKASIKMMNQSENYK
ncbi:MAG: hypothetical protein HW421_2349 [Ignavibacteria bacterium]|nr:hypothetical protein [Ignavibacteria bacterium]